MANRSRNGSISVHNVLLDNVGDAGRLPTFLLDLHRLPKIEAEAAIEGVATLQTLSPTFRVVVMADISLFRATTALGWPFEHVMPFEHACRLMDPKQFQRYLASRFEIAFAHYSDLTLVQGRAYDSILTELASLLGRSDLLSVVRDLSSVLVSDVNSCTTHLSMLSLSELFSAGFVQVNGAEGSASIEVDDCLGLSFFVCPGGPGSEDLSRVRIEYSIPDDVAIIRVSFDANSSIRFEAFIYAELARNIRNNLFVVMPDRIEAVLQYDVLNWVDLSVVSSCDSILVIDDYAEGYRLLSGGDVLDWSYASRYAVVRRVARNFVGEGVRSR